MTPEDESKLDHLFTYHPPKPEQIPRFIVLRDAAKDLAKQILVNCPPCSDRSAAIRLVREAVMTANAAIALKGATSV